MVLRIVPSHLASLHRIWHHSSAARSAPSCCHIQHTTAIALLAYRRSPCGSYWQTVIIHRSAVRCWMHWLATRTASSTCGCSARDSTSIDSSRRPSNRLQISRHFTPSHGVSIMSVVFSKGAPHTSLRTFILCLCLNGDRQEPEGNYANVGRVLKHCTEFRSAFPIICITCPQ